MDVHPHLRLKKDSFLGLTKMREMKETTRLRGKTRDTGKVAGSTIDAIRVAIVGGITRLRKVAHPRVAGDTNAKVRVSITDGTSAADITRQVTVGIEMMMNAIIITNIGVRMIKDLVVGDHRLAIPILYLITLYSLQLGIGPATNTAMTTVRVDTAALATNIDKTWDTIRQR